MLLRRAKWFLEEAEDSLEKRRYDLACFLAEQSAQLRVKAALLRVIGDYPKLHQLRLLLNMLGDALHSCRDMVMRFIRENRSLLSELEDAYLLARYGVKEYDADDAKEMLETAKRIWRLVEEVEERCSGDI